MQNYLDILTILFKYAYLLGKPLLQKTDKEEMKLLQLRVKEHKQE